MQTFGQINPSFPRAMSDNRISSPVSSKRELQAIVPEQAVVVLRQSFETVVQWEKLPLPSWFVIGGGDLRKLGSRIRKQPTEFMGIVCQSLQTAKNGQILCERGIKTTSVLLGEETSSEKERQEFTCDSLQEIRDSASGLSHYTNVMHNQCRTLRTGFLGIHTELSHVTEKRQQRPDFLVQLSRSLSRYVKDCEGSLRQVYAGIEQIEQSLTLIVACWEKIASLANYLLTTSNSPLTAKQNTIVLKEIRDHYMTLESYFKDYTTKICQLYDENVIKLQAGSQKHLKATQDYPRLTFDDGTSTSRIRGNNQLRAD